MGQNEDAERMSEPTGSARAPDARYELANERTYLAWLRTGLALVAAGVAAERLLPAAGVDWVRQVIGVSLVLVGALSAGLARRRWAAVDLAMKAGQGIPRSNLGYLISGTIVVDGLAAVFLMIRADALGR
jgi:putative membrane protein